jgi:excinuclease ABC subunit A
MTGMAFEKIIRVRGARQNNLQGFDLDLPLGQLIVVTGPSGSGKSSFAFDTLYAEGQRRYVETFSPYTRQFLERMDKPKADLIEGIPPAIAIEQANSIRSTRSSVGTITEINDYLKLFFQRAAGASCPSCSRAIRTESAASLVGHILDEMPGVQVLITFGVSVPAKTKASDFFDFLRQQGYLRVWLNDQVIRIDDPPKRLRLPAVVPVIQDRIEVSKANRSRLSEAVESALRLGSGKISVLEVDGGAEHPFSSGWHCPHCDIDIRPPSPGLFTFNNPLGACPECRGFGRIVGIDWGRVLPDRSLSLAAGVVRPFQSGQSRDCQRDLLRAAAIREVDVHTAFEDLPKKDQKWVLQGDPGADEHSSDGLWYGVEGFFRWLAAKTYKMHIRVLLSRYRNYQPCPSCRGGRFQPETLNYRLAPLHKTLPEIAATPVRDLVAEMESTTLPEGDPGAVLLRDQILSRLRFLNLVGLGYLTLDRPTRSLSGGEIERVNLTTCLGASLVNTLFVMDEPSVGLHPRDTHQLVEVLHALRDKGNTIIVVEHEEAIIRAADHVVDIGPGRGTTGGKLIFNGPLKELLKAPKPGSPLEGMGSLTADYLTGAKSIPIPAKRRLPEEFIEMRGIRHHNLQNVDVDIPIGVFCVVTGVSGSGKSSLVYDVLYRNLAGVSPDEHESPGVCDSITGDEGISEIIMVDQSPLARSPRSTPAVYLGVFDVVRGLFGTRPAALAAGLSPSSFSFNAGDGRCERCSGLGFEKVEMQFLSDLYLRCPECEGRRYQPHILDIKLGEKSIHDVLEMTSVEALEFFAGNDRITGPLQLLADVGLDYLRLGQPVNALSGGESQRLKLAGHLVEKREEGALLIFDEPTTGLHFDDIASLLKVFQRLVDEGNTLVVVEHNLEVIKSADWLVDIGPDAGDLGGKIVAAGPPEKVARCKGSPTGKFLAKVLAGVSPTTLLAKGSRSSEKRLTPSPAIRVLGAREHNLKNISVEIPREKIVVVTGLSGSGKSTLAFDVLFAEGQRRFLDSMSAYARQFVDQLEKPDVDSIEGLPPSVAIEQRVTRGGGKSTVATVTEIYHFLRLLFAKLGVQHCPDCQVPVQKRTLTAIADIVSQLAKGGAVEVFAPLVKARKGHHTKVAQTAARKGIEFLLVDGELEAVDRFTKLERFKEHTIDALVGEVGGESGKPALDIVKRALELGGGVARVRDAKGHFHILSAEMNCPGCSRAFEPLDPRLFSFNSPHGWCTHCRGFGEVWTEYSDKEFDSVLDAELAEERRHENLDDGESRTCPICQGTRLNETARNVFLQEKNVTAITSAPATEAFQIISKLNFQGREREIATDITAEISQRLQFLSQVGLNYLSLDRAANTLSGGESQRIRLAAQLGSNLRGVLYVLDEPTIGLHARDNARLLDALEALAKNGNSLVIVEHDDETMRRADHIIDLGPMAGIHGGEIVASGTFADICANKKSLTGQFLKKPMIHPSQGFRRSLEGPWIELTGASAHNLKGVDVRFPINRLSVVSGISGSGKSTLVRGVLLPAVKGLLARTRKKSLSDDPWKTISGAESLGAVLEVDQSPIGKTSRSTPATYIKVFDLIRNLYASLPAARMRGYTASRFSFNNEGGRCECCQGQAVIKLEMSFLPSSYMPCQECEGKRYNSATLEVDYNGSSIGDVMDMTVEQAAELFAAHPKIKRALDLLNETGLGYLKLGQPSPTLSGGEAQRIKLVTQLTRRATPKAEEIKTARRGKSTLYILEEPTIGLHAHDVAQLIKVLHRLVDEGGTVIVIEHHLDVIAEADYVVDVGPEAGGGGGELVAAGTPEEVAQSKASRTAPFLLDVLEKSRK